LEEKKEKRINTEGTEVEHREPGEEEERPS